MFNLRIVSQTIPLLGIFLLPAFGVTQTTPVPPDYTGVQIHIPGVDITPIPFAPFSADVKIITHQKLADGTETVRMTINHIARDSAGRFYNESRSLVPTTFKGEPGITSARIYDPVTRLNIFYNPQVRLAREVVLQPQEAARQVPMRAPLPTLRYPLPPSRTAVPSPVKETDLGDQFMDDTILHGTMKQRTIDAAASGTGQPVTITDEYWYSPDLDIYLIVKHDDPRSGEQIVAVTHIDRHEPPADKFVVPDGYKIVDETPPPPLATHTPAK